MEEQVENYEYNLRELVKMDISTGNIIEKLKDYTLTNAGYDSFTHGIGANQMILTESEALNYKSIILQIALRDLQTTSYTIQGASIEVQLTSTENQIASLTEQLASIETQKMSMELNQNFFRRTKNFIVLIKKLL